MLNWNMQLSVSTCKFTAIRYFYPRACYLDPQISGKLMLSTDIFRIVK